MKIYLAWAEKYNLDAVLTIKTVNSFELSVPSDLRGKPLDDATVKARFGALLTAIAPFLGTRVKWVNLANEVDIYYGNRQFGNSHIQVILPVGGDQARAIRN